ncbi:MAG: cysteine desulfurase [Acidiferrobacterales bacterium]|nr:cysteine desulfurase [Acidiferrobacterales bacterium]
MNTAHTEFDIALVRNDFPILDTEVNGRPLIYLDNGATAQKPQSVIDVIDRYYSEQNANIHRGVHQLSQLATQAYENARETIQHFLGARHSYEVLFTKGTTDGINLVASSWGRQNLNPGDEVIISTMEHHSNIVPWQMICEEKGAILKVIPIHDSGELDMAAFDSLLSDRTKMVATVHVSNSLGTINPVDEIICKAHSAGALVLLDGAQSVPHMRVNVTALDVDFYTFSGHKIFGPTGVGVLYGKEDLLNAMPPYQGGGDMIEKVTFEKTTYNTLPHKFEAGTPNIVGGIGLAAAIDYVSQFDPSSLAAHEQDLLDYATATLSEVPGVRIIGTAEKKASVISFVVDGLHPFDVGTLLDQQGIAVRTGHHCTQPLMDRYGIPGTIRASFAIYNNRSDVDVFVAALGKAVDMLA